MRQHDWKPVLEEVAAAAASFLTDLPGRPVGPRATVDQLREALGGPLPEGPSDAREVVARLVAAADPGLMATPGGRFFGFVIGGSLPASMGADWLATTWDQNASLYGVSPAAAVVEEVAASWVLNLLGLPRDASVGFVTGGQMAIATCLAAARHHVLRKTGWDVERRGLWGGPPITVYVSRVRHVTVDRALRFLGLGEGCIEELEVDAGARIRPDDLAGRLASASSPAIVCTQVGEVNTGAIDPVGQIADVAHDHGAWVHVDGAIGLWAAASPGLARHTEGLERADSWATDAHKWLNVPYDSGIAITSHPDAHRQAMGLQASYLTRSEGNGRDPVDWAPELSRRARGFAVWAALRSLGRSGLVELVDRCHALARRFADLLSSAEGVRVLNEVVLNQVLVRFDDDDETTRRVIAAVQQDGTCWLGGTTWRGDAAMRISVSNWLTDEDDVERSVEAILRCHRSVTQR